MSEHLSLRDQLAYLIAERPGMSSKELVEFLGASQHGSVSGTLAIMYRKGGYRREKDADHKGKGRAPYRYYRDDSGLPPTLEHGRNRRTARGEAAEIERLNSRIAKLEEWQANALVRFPDLAVPEALLNARKHVADQLRDEGDLDGSKRVLAGERDNTLVVRAVLRVLEEA